LLELRQTRWAMFDKLRSDGFSASPEVVQEHSFERDVEFAAA